MILIKLTLMPLGLIYAVALAGVFLGQRQLQYFPSRADPAPAEVGLAGVSVETLATADGETLVLWHAPARGNRPTVLFLHGNAGSIADRAPRLAFLQAEGFGAAFLSYRGYGGSSGSISEAGLLTDARAAHDFLVANGVPADRIAVVGESLGTGVAIQLAAERPIGALILEAPYTAAVDVAAAHYPWLPVRILMKDQFHSLGHISRVNAPVLILHGTDDSVIPYAHGQRIFAAAPQPKSFVTLDSQGHEALFDPATWALEARFLNQLFPP
jgi:uncharacterized protein